MTENSIPSGPIIPTPSAVVFDTNLWGKGTLDVKQLSKHAARLAKSGVEVWIPYQVLLEWASHAIQDAEAVLPIWNRLRRAGIASTFPISADRKAILAQVEATVMAIPNVTVLPMTGDAAIAGLQDQILGVGAGDVRNGVKTGGVDSSWVRDAVAAAGGDGSTLVFVTKNAKDVHATAKVAGFGPINVRSEHTLYSSLFGASAAPDGLTRMIAAHLATLVDDANENPDPHQMPAESLLPIGDIEPSRALADQPYDPIVPTAVSLAPGSKIVGMVEVEVVNSVEAKDGASVDQPFSSTVEFVLIVLADLAISGYELDQDGTVQMRSAEAYSTVVVAPVVADVDDLHIEVASSGSASVATAETRFDEGHEALEWLLGELAGFGGVTLVDDDIELEEFCLTGLDGTSVIATLDGDPYDEWALHFELGSTSVYIACVFDAGARVWAGKESLDSRPPYYLVSSNDPYEIATGEPYSAMGEVWRHLIQQ